MQTTAVLEKILQDDNLNLTHARTEVLHILLSSKKPMTAYEVLDQLKKIRPNAEPPTVYRALAYLVEKKLTHRIESNNHYVCCAHLSDFKSACHGVLFICHHCDQAFEYFEEDANLFIKKITKKYDFLVSDTLIEIKGICKNCHHNA